MFRSQSFSPLLDKFIFPLRITHQRTILHGHATIGFVRYVKEKAVVQFAHKVVGIDLKQTFNFQTGLSGERTIG